MMSNRNKRLQGWADFCWGEVTFPNKLSLDLFEPITVKTKNSQKIHNHAWLWKKVSGKEPNLNPAHSYRPCETFMC